MLELRQLTHAAHPGALLLSAVHPGRLARYNSPFVGMEAFAAGAEADNSDSHPRVASGLSQAERAGLLQEQSHQRSQQLMHGEQVAAAEPARLCRTQQPDASPVSPLSVDDVLSSYPNPSDQLPRTSRGRSWSLDELVALLHKTATSASEEQQDAEAGPGGPASPRSGHEASEIHPQKGTPCPREQGSAGAPHLLAGPGAHVSPRAVLPQHSGLHAQEPWGSPSPRRKGAQQSAGALHVAGGLAEIFNQAARQAPEPEPQPLAFPGHETVGTQRATCGALEATESGVFSFGGAWNGPNAAHHLPLGGADLRTLQHQGSELSIAQAQGCAKEPMLAGQRLFLVAEDDGMIGVAAGWPW